MPDERDDDRLEEELRRLAAIREPVPPGLISAAMDAFGWRDIDAELAGLVYDSLLDSDAAALVRGGHGQRLFSFRAGEVTVDVEVTRSGEDRGLLGQIEPPRAAIVDIRRRRDVITVTADELGRFQSQALSPGPLSLRLRPPAGGAGPSLTTDWVSI